MKYSLGCIKSKVEKSDFLIEPLLLDTADDKRDIDFTDKQSEVKNQKGKGSCVGFSGVAVKESQEFIENGKFLDLSEQWLYEKSRIRGGYKEGATLKDCFHIVAHEGVPFEEYWPYTTDKNNIGAPRKGAAENAMIYRVNDKLYFRLTSEKQIRATLLKYGSFQLGLTVYENWTKREKDGHIPVHTFCERKLGGHGIDIVGDLKSQEEYKFKNSWGLEWGDEGYGYIPYAEMKRAFMDAFAWVDIKNIDKKPIMTVGDLPKEEKDRLCRE